MEFTWTIIIIIGLTFVIRKLAKKESFNLKGESVFNIMSYIGYVLLTSIFLLMPLPKYHYSSSWAVIERTKYHIPCINSSMELTYREQSEETWQNKTTYRLDSIQHHKKVIKIGRAGIYEEHDYFVNLYLDKALVLKTTIPSGFFGKYETHHQLINHVSLIEIYSTTLKIDLDSHEADSVLAAWGMKHGYDCDKRN